MHTPLVDWFFQFWNLKQVTTHGAFAAPPGVCFLRHRLAFLDGNQFAGPLPEFFGHDLDCRAFAFCFESGQPLLPLTDLVDGKDMPSMSGGFAWR